MIFALEVVFVMDVVIVVVVAIVRFSMSLLVVIIVRDDGDQGGKGFDELSLVFLPSLRLRFVMFCLCFLCFAFVYYLRVR